MTQNGLLMNSSNFSMPIQTMKDFNKINRPTKLSKIKPSTTMYQGSREKLLTQVEYINKKSTEVSYIEGIGVGGNDIDDNIKTIMLDPLAVKNSSNGRNIKNSSLNMSADSQKNDSLIQF